MSRSKKIVLCFLVVAVLVPLVRRLVHGLLDCVDSMDNSKGESWESLAEK